MQKGEALLTQKTSRQQEDTPRFWGRFAKDVSLCEDAEEGLD